MKKILKYIGIAAVVVVLGVVVVGAVALAQSGTGDSNQPFNYYERFRQALAGILGISVDQYDNAVTQAQTQVLQDAVNEGWLTQSQADEMQQRLDAAPQGGMPWGMKPGFGERGWEMHDKGVDLFSVAADKLGMTQSDLVAELRNGKTIAGLATDKGVDVQTIIDAYVAQLTEKLNQAVTAGTITQKQADWQIEQAKARVTEQLNGAWKEVGHRGFPGKHELNESTTPPIEDNTQNEQ